MKPISQSILVLAIAVATYSVATLPGVKATFADRVYAGTSITIGNLGPTPAPATPAECAGMTFGEVIVGTPGDDTINAGNGGALVFGLGGSDTITGGNARDCLVGGDGDETLVGGNGKDVLLGGEGNDTLYGGGDTDTLEGGNGKDLLNGGDGTDACYGTNKDTFVGCETTSVSGAAPVPTPDPPASLAPTTTPAPDEIPIPGSEANPTPGPTLAPTATPAPPEVDFSFTTSGLTAVFRNPVNGATTWTWDFGDGTTSTARNPSHTYAAASAYSVTLTALTTGAPPVSKAMDVTVVGP